MTEVRYGTTDFSIDPFQDVKPFDFVAVLTKQSDGALLMKEKTEKSISIVPYQGQTLTKQLSSKTKQNNLLLLLLFYVLLQ